MIDKLNAIGAQALRDVEGAKTTDALEQIRVAVLGKKGALSEVLKTLGAVGPAERPKIGAVANDWKQKIESALQARQEALGARELEAKLAGDRIDVTLPSRRP